MEGFGNDCGASDVSIKNVEESSSCISVFKTCDPGVVDQNIQTAELLVDGLGGCCDGVVVGDVKLDKGDGAFRVRCLDFLEGCFTLLNGPAPYDDMVGC